MNLFVVMMILAALAVVASLFTGLFFMAREGEENRKKSNKAMQARVLLQGFAVIMFALAMMSQG